jgi:hypothetical protein
MGAGSWIGWLGRVLAGIAVALRAVLVYDEADRLVRLPHG